MATRQFTKWKAITLDTDQFRCDDLISERIFKDSILVNTRLVRKGITTNDSFIFRNWNTREARNHFRRIHCFIQNNITSCLEEILTNLQSNSYFFKSNITCAFTDTINSSLDTSSTVFNCCQSICSCHTEIIVTVDTKDNFMI